MIFFSIAVVWIIYFFSLSNSIYGGDAGDLVSAILTRGFAHPPGYSLYTQLGIFFNSFPFPLSAAGKVTLISTVSTCLSFVILYKIIRIIFGSRYYNKTALLITLFVLGTNYIVWLYAIVPEVFPLNTLIILCFIYATLTYCQSQKPVYLYCLSFLLGLAFSHHQTFLLVLPSAVYLLWHKKLGIKLTVSHVILLIIVFVAGLLPNLHLYFASIRHAALTWGSVTNLKELLYVLLRQGYGTFVAGSFVSNFPAHRFLQIKNVFLYIKNDFTYLGIIALLVGFFEYIRLPNSRLKILLTAVIINIFFFGPFFFFYANFPLASSFFFATLERFLHIFYFFLGIMIYLGIVSLLHFFQFLVQRLITHIHLKNLAYGIASVLFFIYPVGQYARNFPVISTLRNNQIAEHLGADVLNSVPDRSLILLSGDTILFDTQYVYYSAPKKYRDKIIVHASKLSTNFYKETLKFQYPAVRFDSKKPHSVEYFIQANVDYFQIYTNDRYPLSILKGYAWIPQGLLYKLVKNSDINEKTTVQTIEWFWRTSLNRQLSSKVIKNDPAFKNLFLVDILRVYSIGHQNSAYYFLENKYEDLALEHINDSIILQPDDADNHFLRSKYFARKNDCTSGEKEIMIAITNARDELYLNQLKELGDRCYTQDSEKKRIEDIMKKYQKDKTVQLRSF